MSTDLLKLRLCDTCRGNKFIYILTPLPTEAWPDWYGEGFIKISCPECTGLGIILNYCPNCGCKFELDGC
jgi:hypothetical protein